MGLKPYITSEKDYIVGLRRYFHRHPEPSLKEFETARRIEEELDALAVVHRRVGETGVVAFVRGKAGGGAGAVALRADIDALPIAERTGALYASEREGFMHACGHDGHAASLLGAARALKGKEAEFSGEVRLFFQQAEEIGQGARQFVAAGLLDGVGAILGTHLASLLPVGTMALTGGPTNASCDWFRITVRGRSAHVSTPHRGVDAAYIASKTVVELQSIVARRTDPLDPVVVGVGLMRAGTNYNIVANEATIEGTTRTFSPEARKRTNEAVARTAALAAQAEGGSAETRFEAYAAPLVNDEKVAARGREVARGFAEVDRILDSIPKSLGADDFADYLQVVPGVYAFIGSRNATNPATAMSHHNELFDIDEEALLVAANLYADFALDFLRPR